MSDAHPLQVRITALTAEWYALIGPEHHKDRDCHFGIDKLWSYGQPPVYRVWHDGYIADLVQRDFPTADAAHRFLADLLARLIAAERKAQDAA